MIRNIELIPLELSKRSILVEGLLFYHESALKQFYCKLFYDFQLGSANPSLIVHLVSFNSHAICTPSGSTRPLSSWLGFPAQVHTVNSDAAHWSYYLIVSIHDLCHLSYLLYWGYSRLIWETDKLIALQLTLVSMLNLTAVVFTSVLGIAGNHFTRSLY